jgi:hypothetical protein
MEGEAGDLSARPADGLPLSIYPDLASRSARCILNEGDTMTICYAKQSWHVAGHSKLMNGQNGSGPRGHGVSHEVRFDIESGWVDIDKNWCRTTTPYTVRRRNEGVTCCNHLISWSGTRR